MNAIVRQRVLRLLLQAPVVEARNAFQRFVPEFEALYRLDVRTNLLRSEP